MIVLALDPGLSRLGFCCVHLHRDGEKLLEVGVLRTERSAKKRGVLASDDLTRRARELWRGLRDVVRRHPPAAICVEAVSFPRSSSAAAKTAMARGLVVALAEVLGDLPISEASPQAVKAAVTGRKDASKEDVERAILERWPTAEARCSAARIRRGDREHAFDACAVFVAALESDTLRMARRLTPSETTP